MPPLAPIVPLVIAGLVAWRLVTRSTVVPATKRSRITRSAASTRTAHAPRNGRTTRARKKRSAG